MNKQPIEKQVIVTDRTLDVHSVFLTIQGEGPYCGHRAVFVRLAGCNLQCPGCDTEYTEGRERLRIMDLFDRVNGAANYKPKTLVVITGGEPFRQDIAAFANLLIDMGHPVQIETNGTLPPSEGLDARVVVVCSPKTGKINPIMLKRLDCFKYVLHSESVTENGLPIKALGHSAKPFVAQPPEGNRKPVYLQPMDSKNIAQNERNNAAVLKSCLDNGYILQLQIHKLIGVE